MSFTRRDDGGATFIEVLATFVMVAVAVVVTTYSLFFGHRALGVDMHKQQIARLVQQELEYWVGRVYLGGPGDPNNQEMVGSPNTPYKIIGMDQQSANPIDVRLYYDPIVGKYFAGGEAETYDYYIVTVWAEWTEADGQEFTRDRGNGVLLTTYVGRPGG